MRTVLPPGKMVSGFSIRLKKGWLAWITDEDKIYAFDGAAWVSASASSTPASFSINTGLDPNNRLSIQSDSILFSHDATTPGSGDTRTVFNKLDTSATASLIFQTNFSGRAEFGTTGDDDWRVKVSPDGSTWNEALVVDKNTGAIRFPAGVEHAVTRAPLTGLIHTPGGKGENSVWRSNSARSGTPRTAEISSIGSDVVTLTTDVADQFFSDGYMKDVSYVQIFNTAKIPAEVAWVKSQPALNQLQVIDANTISGWLATETIQLRDPSKSTAMFALDISQMLQNQLGAVFPQAGIMCKTAVQMTSAVRGQIGLSPTAESGSLQNVFSFPDGSLNGGMVIIACTEPSPVSNSNLIYIIEGDGGVDTLLTGLVSVFGVYG